MKLPALCLVLCLAGLFMVGSSSSLEARHRNFFSLNIGPVLAPAPAPAYVVERYPAYVDYWGYPYRETVVVQPAPRVVYYPQPQVSFGFGWMFR